MKNPSSETQTNRLASPTPLAGVHPILDWKAAQGKTNFVIIAPKKGGEWRTAMATIRGESPLHHSTVRYVLQDADGRRLRVKQYFHDWWIPTVCDISFRKPGHPLTYGESVAYVGRDYRRNDGSCGHVWGTGVEFSLEGGRLTDEDWYRLWNSLDAIDPEAVKEARATTFAQRNYWNRWKRVDAPWDSTEISSLAWSPPTNESLAQTAWAITADAWAPVPGAIDSLGQRKGPYGQEVQAVFRWPMDLNTSAWLRVLKKPPEPWRPLIDSGEVNRPQWTKMKIAGVDIERAYMDPAVGNWYYAWRRDDRTYELHLRAQKGLDMRKADRVVEGLLA